MKTRDLIEFIEIASYEAVPVQIQGGRHVVGIETDDDVMAVFANVLTALGEELAGDERDEELVQDLSDAFASADWRVTCGRTTIGFKSYDMSDPSVLEDEDGSAPKVMPGRA
jgi:hypothetical protein